MNNETKVYYMNKEGKIVTISDRDYSIGLYKGFARIVIGKKSYKIEKIRIPHIGSFYIAYQSKNIFLSILAEKLAEWRDKEVIELIV